MKQSSYSTAITVQKAFRILELLGEKQPARPAELIQQMKISRSNLYRLLTTLQKIGYVERTGDSRYRLSFKMFMLGSTVSSNNLLSDIAPPYMAQLAEISQENINLAILFEKKVLYIKKIESPHYLKLDQPIGRTDPLHCTTLGKALLSGLADEELKVFLKTIKLIPYTKKTITDREALVRVIRSVRRKGYATDLEELSEGIHCIGAPIRDHTNEVIAAMSISAPAVRLTIKKMEMLKDPLIEASLQISKKLGYMEANKAKGI